MLKPLILNEIDVPFWIWLFPFSKYSYMKKQINSALTSRGNHEVEVAWMDAGIEYEKIEYILNIIAKYCDWKSINFIPSDECSCVFMDHDMELGVITAISEVEDCCPHIRSGQLYEHLKPNSNLLYLIHFVLENRDRK